jgi:hypothetical protein
VIAAMAMDTAKKAAARLLLCFGNAAMFASRSIDGSICLWVERKLTRVAGFL